MWCHREAQAPCNEIIGGWACRSHRGLNFSAWFWSFYNTKFTKILWNNAVFEFPKEHQRCSKECTDFNGIDIMCLREAQAPRLEVRMCLRQAQAPCNEIIGGWACRSHCGWNFSVWFWSFYNTKFTKICWNDGVFEFSKEHQRCSIEYTDFNAIEIMCLRLRSGTKIRSENVPSTGSGTECSNK